MELVVAQHQSLVLAFLAKLADAHERFAQVVVQTARRPRAPTLRVDTDLELPIADGKRADGIDGGLKQLPGPLLEAGRQAEASQRAIHVCEHSIGKSRRL